MATIIPAYGRDYKSAKAALEDFHANMDFKTQSMDLGYDQYICKSQLVGVKNLVIRFNDNRYTAVVPEVTS